MSGAAGKPEWQDVEQLLAAALELPEEQREAFLARQPAPVRLEVESLLSAHRRVGLGGETDLDQAGQLASRF